MRHDLRAYFASASSRCDLIEKLDSLCGISRIVRAYTAIEEA